MSKIPSGALLILALAASGSRAQVVMQRQRNSPADYLTAVGALTESIGRANVSNAQADRFNAQTFMMLNEYWYNVVKNETRENAQHRAAMRAKAIEAYNKIQDRIKNQPLPTDIEKGDALNKTLDDLLGPGVSPSASSYARVPVESGAIRKIPFKLGEKGEVFSMDRLLLRGPKKWAVAFQDPAYDGSRRAYERAVEEALERAIEGKMTDAVLRDIEKAIDDVEVKLRLNPRMHREEDQRLYAEARKHLDRMRATVRLFMTKDIQQVFREIDTYAGTTLDDLKIFMVRHHLRFGAADTPDERELYPRLLTALIAQRQMATGSDASLGSSLAAP